MAEHPTVPRELTTAAIEASPALQRFYVIGGGSISDLRTDMSHALAAVLLRVIDVPDQVIDLDRRRAQVAFTGPERRQRRAVRL